MKKTLDHLLTSGHLKRFNSYIIKLNDMVFSSRNLLFLISAYSSVLRDAEVLAFEDRNPPLIKQCFFGIKQPSNTAKSIESRYQFECLQVPSMGHLKDSDHQDEIAQLRASIEKLQSEKLLQGDEIRALKAEARSYRDDLSLLNSKIQSLEEQELHDTHARKIGKEVRLRYLEQHRRRMGKSIGDLGRSRTRSGDFAAHRGRPEVDALLCLTGLITDREVYPDLYGVKPETLRQWKDVEEIIQITGFHASLQSEGKLTSDFQVPFDRLLALAKTFVSSVELKAAFSENKALQRLHGELQNCFDKIMNADPH